MDFKDYDVAIAEIRRLGNNATFHLACLSCDKVRFLCFKNCPYGMIHYQVKPDGIAKVVSK